jgi:dynein heavy chain
MRDKLRRMDPETTSFATLNFNNFMDASALQVILEQPLEKRSGVRYGPVGGKRLIYFIDDMNMPYVDKYDTQSPIELARQFVDYRGWYDKTKIVLKEVLDCGYVACMNPTAGSFNITPRMQRHFATFAVQMPSSEIVRSIYMAMVDGHLSSRFSPDVAKLSAKLVDATVELHRMVSSFFLTSAVKFHYQFNLRDLSAVVQGLCRMQPEYHNKPADAVRLWVHECERVFLDRMINATDMGQFQEMRKTVVKKFFDDSELMAAAEKLPNVHTSFMKFTPEENPVYYGCDDYARLNKVLTEKLNEHNETNATMDLVLFNQAMEHVSRIARIIEVPRGNALLVGVGGSGKQSLAKLAAFICGYEVFQISVTSSYGVAEFKADLVALYNKTGIKGTPVMFLLTDSHIVQERFLVYVNDLLSSGFIPDLMTAEEKDNCCNAVRNELKATGAVDTNEALWDFFIEKVRKNLHVVLCFSPAGDTLRIRARNFPALINNTSIDWFQNWPHDALISVASRFLKDVPDVEPAVLESVALHMAFAHTSVSEASQQYLEQIRRYNYTTPKGYLELISLYKQLLEAKRAELKASRDRLENGVDKIAQASAQVAELQEALKGEMVIVEEKKAATDALIVSIGKEKAIVDEAVAAGKDDEEACSAIAAEVSEQQTSCAEDLKVAEPVIAEAEAALNSLDKKALGELKSFGSPAAEIVSVMAACMTLTAPGGKIPKDVSWNAAKKFMGSVDVFLNSLQTFDKDNTPANCIEKCEKEYLSLPGFNPENIKSKSQAAAGLCSWVVNICKYWHIYQVVAPKRALLAEANKKLDAANKKLSGVRAKVQELQDRVALLEADLMKATEEKNAAVAAADKTAAKAGLADRLVNGLSSENTRWRASIAEFNALEARLVGDVLVASAFVSYAGPFNSQFRQTLLEEKWLPDLRTRGIPMSDNADVIDLLCTDSDRALWGTQGLPSDPLSIENGAIMSSAARYSLMIDPQLQGIAWVRNKEEANGLKIIQLSTPRYIETVEHCIENGIPLLIENLPEEIDAVLDPVIARQTIRRGRNTYVRLGGKEVPLDPKFKLYLQTKLSNPHYRPEVATQTTLVNFCVTEKGLEDQLLALVVGKERPDLQEQAATLVRQLGEYTITLKDLEDSLLKKLAESKGDILEDIELIENLESTKRTATEIAEKVAAAKVTEVVINEAREAYRPVAARGALFYFIVDSLWVLDRVYQYSMANFVHALNKGMDQTPGGPDESKVPEAKRIGEVSLEERVKLLVTTTTRVVWDYFAAGLFERHKLIVAAQLAFGILRQRGELSALFFDFFLKGPRVVGGGNPLPEWMPDSAWGSVQALKEIEEFGALPDDIIGSAKRWRDWMESERPEEEPMPGEWKKLPAFAQLLLYRALRPDRMSNVLSSFVAAELGREYVSSAPFDLDKSYLDATKSTPIFTFLSPGVDVAAAVEALGRKLGFTADKGNYATVSLGQGQEPIAMERLAAARKNGGWVLLQNIHLTIDWTNGPLEKCVDKLVEGTHDDFRLFLSAEPPPSLEKPLAISLLQNSIKLTNEPPQGMKANLVRAYGNFNDDMFEACAKQVEFKAIVFALCYFHAALLERKKFGVGNLPGSTSGIGWNMNYPFNVRLPRKRACLVCSRADTRLSPRLRRLATCCAAASWPTTTWRTAARCLGTT